MTTTAPTRDGGLPPSPSQVSAEWFTRVLRDRGILTEAERVTEIRQKSIGNGLIGESIRYELSYEGASDATGGEHPRGPSSVVCKFPSSVPGYREMAIGEALYSREITFYADLAQRTAIRAPQCYVIDSDTGTNDFVLMLEDLGPAATGDQLAGCTISQAEYVIDAAAALHAPLWGDPTLSGCAWDVRESWIPHIAATYPGLFEQYAEAFGTQLTETVLSIGERFAPGIASWFAGQTSSPWTVIHGDFRLDNMLFDIRGGAERVGIVDWQTILPGPGAADVSYFLGGCLTIEERRAHEHSLLERYHANLVDRGVRGYSFDQCRQDYAYNAFLGYFMSTYPVMLVPRTERGDAMFLSWVERTAAQIHDLDATSLLP